MNATRAMLDPVFARVHKKLEQGCHVKVVVEMNNWTKIDVYAAASGEPLFTATPGINTHPDYIAAAIYDQLQPSGPYYEKLRAHPLAAAPGPAGSAQGPAAPVARGPVPAPASDVDTPAYKSAEQPNVLALIIGIEKYAPDTGLPDAEFAERDAQAMREHLIALGYASRNIALLTGQKASFAGIRKNLETWLPNHVDENSTVFFYYSGHGSPDPQTGQAYLVPFDGDPQYLKDTAYPMKRIYEQLNALKARRVIVSLDSCFSGLKGRSVLAKGTKPLVSKVDLGMTGAGKVISLTASGSGEISGTADDQGHGLFTYYLLKGLNGDAKDKDGAVSVKSLYGYLSDRVSNAAKKDNRDQTPQLVMGDSSDFRLR